MLTPKTAPAAPVSSASIIAGVLATPCANTELTPEAGNIEAIDAATLCLVNQERARNGELPLRPNAQLAQAAQGHSEEMVSDDYFAHVAPSGLDASRTCRRHRLCTQLRSRLYARREHRLGHAPAEHPERDRRGLDRLARAPREHPLCPLRRHRDRRRPRGAGSARRRPAGRGLLAGVRRDRRMSERWSGLPSPALVTSDKRGKHAHAHFVTSDSMMMLIAAIAIWLTLVLFSWPSAAARPRPTAATPPPPRATPPRPPRERAFRGLRRTGPAGGSARGSARAVGAGSAG